MRPGSSGLLVWSFLVLAIAIPIWMFWPGGHPLKGANQLELCPKIRAPSEALVPRPDGFAGPSPDEARSSTGFCRLHFPPQPGEGSRTGDPKLSIIVTSQRTFAKGDLRVRTDRFMEVNVNEMKASGNAPEVIKGPWRTGVVVTRAGKAVDVHIEDEGVLMLIASSNIPRESVVEFAVAVAKALRQRA
jgi:hypothetical protein